MVPKIAMGEVLAALRLKHIAVLRLLLVKPLGQGVNFWQMVNRLSGMRIGKPEAVTKAKAGVAIEGNRKIAPEQFIFDQFAQRAALRLHCAARRAALAAKPGQAGRHALAAQHEGNLRG